MIIRSPRTDHFTVVDNAMVTDKRLSFAARGLLTFLLSKPDHWQVNVKNLVSESPLGRDGVYKLLSELVDHRYVIREQAQNRESGKFNNVNWIIYDKPYPGNPEAVKSVDKSPDTGKPEAVNVVEKAVDNLPVTEKPEAGKPPKSKTETDTASGITVSGKAGHIVNTDKSKYYNTRESAPDPVNKIYLETLHALFADNGKVLFSQLLPVGHEKLRTARRAEETMCDLNPTVDEINQAIEKGLAAMRKQYGKNQVASSYLLPIVKELIAGRGKPSPRGARKGKKSPPWWESTKGIQDMASQLGIEQGGKPWPMFKLDVLTRAAMCVKPDMAPQEVHASIVAAEKLGAGQRAQVLQEYLR